MRVQFPEPQDILFAVLLLVLTTWQTQLVLAFIAFLLICFHHWIIGGIIGGIALFAAGVRYRFRL